ncbi:MAG: tetratricopeptide repeat protein, partial [Bdellovibrionia bacterium]
MALTDQGLGRTYKIKLLSGRVLGPLDLERVKLLILKNQIIGKEVGRIYPDGEWVDINQIPEIAELLVAHISGELNKDSPEVNPSGYQPILGRQGAYPPDALPGATQVLLHEADALEVETNAPHTPPQLDSADQDDRTMIGQMDDNDDKTRVEEIAPPVEFSQSEPIIQTPDPSKSVQLSFETSAEINAKQKKLAEERTVVFQRSSESTKTKEKPKKSLRQNLSKLFLVGVLGVIGYQALLEEPPKKPVKQFEVVRPQLPSANEGPPDPSKSNQLYGAAMAAYVADTTLGYRTAADKLREAISYDLSNVKALAMLASSYINLIDSSNKDANYFSVLSTLIDMSRAKNVDLAETVIADVEFYLVVNKAEAAQNRIVEYTKAHPSFGVEMFYYLALAFYGRGDNASAAKYLGLIPEDKIFSSKIYYLRGQVAEALNEVDSAMKEYSKAIEFNPGHAKSHLRVSQLLYKQGTLKNAQSHIEFLISHINYLTPRDLGLTYYFHALFSELNQRWKVALGDMEKAVAIDPENHDYLLELYTLRAKGGDSQEDVKQIAKMYYFLGEGEKLIQQGKYQDALIPFLQAREVNNSSPLP